MVGDLTGPGQRPGEFRDSIVISVLNSAQPAWVSDIRHDVANCMLSYLIFDEKIILVGCAQTAVVGSVLLIGSTMYTDFLEDLGV